MNSIETVAEVIQLAVAPVFLLAGIAGLLGVLSTRLARIIDRARVIERRVPQAKRDDQRTLLRRETKVLWRRIALINWAIRLCVSGALAVCLVIVALFVGEFVAFNIALAVAALFVLAMVLIVAGLAVPAQRGKPFDAPHARRHGDCARGRGRRLEPAALTRDAFRARRARSRSCLPSRARSAVAPSRATDTRDRARARGARTRASRCKECSRSRRRYRWRAAAATAQRRPPRRCRRRARRAAESNRSSNSATRAAPSVMLTAGSKRSVRCGAGSAQRRAVSRAVAGVSWAMPNAPADDAASARNKLSCRSTP